MSDGRPNSLEQIQEQIEALKKLKGVLPDEQLNALLFEKVEQLSRYQANLTGQGAIAQGEGSTAAAASHGGTAIGRVQGNVYIGPPTSDPALALRYYRQVIANLSRHIPLRGLDRTASDAAGPQTPLSLTGIYIDLETTTRVVEKPDEASELQRRRDQPDQTRQLRALEAIIAQRRLVLLGDPGSGKSTFVNHLAYCLAIHALEPEAGWLAHLPGWPEAEAGLLPLKIMLRDFAHRYADPLPRRAEPKHLWEFIRAWLADKNLAFVVEALEQQLEQGQALILLDGLDEVPSTSQRRFVRDAVQAFMDRYPAGRYLVTCRTLAYQPPPPDLPDLRLAEPIPTFELAPFDERRIDRFIDAWYGELARLEVVRAEEQAVLANRLRQAVRRPDLWRLAPNPLLLTVMALIHTHKNQLPDARALLYEETIDILLWRWDEGKISGADETPRLRQLLQAAGRADTDLKRVLRELAYQVHAQTDVTGDPNQPADIGELKLQKALAGLKVDEAGQPDLTWASHLIQAMKLRAGLLLERAPELFTFPHRTFQEYLAGAHLAGQPDFAKQAAKLAEAGHFWRQVILLAVGHLVYKIEETARPLMLAGELCPGRMKDTSLAWQKVWLAGEVLVEIGLKRVQDSETGQDILKRVRGRLVELLAGSKLPARERAEAGHVLAGLGDPRPEVMTVDRMQFCAVPPGPVMLGSPDEEPMAYDDEKPLHRLEIGYGYWIGRYPVTVAQWRAFVEATGHEPGDRDSLGDPLNRPVRWVSWTEAVKFCDWLSGRWQAAGLLPAGWQVRLPSEAEWEKAARGGLHLPEKMRLGALGEIDLAEVNRLKADRENDPAWRRYPWGDEPDPDRANYDETGLNDTSAVGCFPGGVSPYGVEEMSGNVWEWTRSLWGKDVSNPDHKYPYDPVDGREDMAAGTNVLRVLRGGGFYSDRRNVRCAVRVRLGPSGRDGNLGFRVVVSPLLTSDL